MKKIIDPYYKKLETNLAIKAGYIEENFNCDIESSSKDLSLGSVLITTGSFGYLHQGHLVMMERAKDALAARGIVVDEGFFSFTHDDYVLAKADNIPRGELRYKFAKDKLANHPWLKVDDWEYKLPGMVNFTTVIEHFKKRYPNKNIYYVFGKDNYNFAYAFKYFGLGIYVPLDDNYPKEIEEYVLVASPTQVEYHSSHFRNCYGLRGDHPLSQEVANLIKKYTSKEVEILEVEEQIGWVKRVLSGRKSISLDMYFKGDFQLEVSRNFDPLSQGSFDCKLVSRSTESISSQVAKIPEGEYVLVDDDIASGQTMSLVKKIFPPHIKVIDTVALSDYKGVNKYFDILDARDFFINSLGSGLVVDDCRTPYWEPFVDLKQRANIFRGREFTQEILKLNLKYLKESKILVKDSYHKDFFIKRGFLEESSVYQCVLDLMDSLSATSYEVGHIYSNEVWGSEQEGALEIYLKQRKSLDKAWFLVDNYNVTGDCRVPRGLYDNIFYEKDLLAFVNIFLSRIPTKWLKRERFRKEGKSVLFFNHGGLKIPLSQETSFTSIYSCQALCATFHTFRLGYYTKEGSSSTRIILPKKYQKKEESVIEMLRLIYPDINISAEYY